MYCFEGRANCPACTGAFTRNISWAYIPDMIYVRGYIHAPNYVDHDKDNRLSVSHVWIVYFRNV